LSPFLGPSAACLAASNPPASRPRVSTAATALHDLVMVVLLVDQVSRHRWGPSPWAEKLPPIVPDQRRTSTIDFPLRTAKVLDFWRPTRKMKQDEAAPFFCPPAEVSFDVDDHDCLSPVRGGVKAVQALGGGPASQLSQVWHPVRGQLPRDSADADGFPTSLPGRWSLWADPGRSPLGSKPHAGPSLRAGAWVAGNGNFFAERRPGSEPHPGLRRLAPVCGSGRRAGHVVFFRAEPDARCRARGESRGR